jgi:hypothetical protein
MTGARREEKTILDPTVSFTYVNTTSITSIEFKRHARVGGSPSIHSFGRSNNGARFPGTWRTIQEQMREIIAINEVRQNRDNIILCDEIFEPVKGKMYRTSRLATYIRKNHVKRIRTEQEREREREHTFSVCISPPKAAEAYCCHCAPQRQEARRLLPLRMRSRMLAPYSDRSTMWVEL